MATSKRAPHGSGSIRQVTKSGHKYWEIRYTVPNDAVNVQTQKSKYFKTKAEASAALRAVTASIDAGTYTEPGKMTLGKWLDIWLKEYVEGKVKPLTVKQYRSMVETHIKPALISSIKLSDLKPLHIQQFYNDLAEENISGTVGQHEKRALSPKTIKNIAGILSKALSTAEEQEIIKRNPTAKARTARVEKKEISPLNSEQIKLFLREVENDQFAPILKLILFTGLRENEAIGLTWDSVDLEKNTLTINKQLLYRPQEEKGYILAETKNSKVRVISIPKSVTDILKAQSKKQKEERLAAGIAWKGWASAEERKKGLVFTMPDGGNIIPVTLYKHYKRIAEKIGAPDSRVHDLRHTYAVTSLATGTDISTVQHSLGHATASFTLDVYCNATDNMKEDAAGRMQLYIDSIQKKKEEAV